MPNRDESASRALLQTERLAGARSIGRVSAPFLTQLIVDVTGAGRASRLDRTRRAAGVYEAAAREKV